jgi:hypothetical protein
MAACRAALLLLVLSLAGCSSVQVVGNGTVVGTWSEQGTLTVAVGGSQTVTLAFTTTDGQAASNLSIISTPLPAGWSAINMPLSCARVATGSGCLLALRYTPLAVASGTLTIEFQFALANGVTQAGAATLAYNATSHDNIVATVSPPGQIRGIVGGSQAVSVQFTTDDGAPATSFAITSNLSALPAGWGSSVPAFSCATVSTGNGCQLLLVFAPTTTGSGTLMLPYNYTDNAGSARSGTVAISYVVTSDNNVIATPSPAGQITAVVGGRNVAVTIGFTTDDGNPATNLAITSGLGTLPAGWIGPASFSCATVAGGNGCALNLTFAPTAVTSGTLIFSYSYTSAAGIANTGTVSVPFIATSDNNVVATPAPSGQIQATVGSSGATVTVTFTTDDGNLASDLTITGGLANLPAGWSMPAATGTPSFGCPTLATGSGCQLALLFDPTTVVTGTLQLSFSYDSNAGVAKTGTVSIPYSSSSHNTVVATVAPSGQVTAELNQGTQVATITFTSDDGNPITNFAVTSGLGTLPADWTGPGSFTCSTVAGGTSCALALQFQPTSASDNGTIALNYSYLDNAGTPQTGSVDVPYTAVPAYFYLAAYSGSVLRCAASFTDGSLSGCINAASGFMQPYGLIVNGNTLYVSDDAAGTVSMCPINIDDTLGSCVVATAPGSNPFSEPLAFAINGSELYTTDANGATPVIACTIDPDSTLSGCVTTAWSVPAPLNVADGITIATASNGTKNAYIVDYSGGNLSTCTVNVPDVSLVNCTQSPIGSTPTGIGAYNANLYVGTGDNTDSNLRCPIAADGSVTVGNCVPTATVVELAQVVGFAFNNGYAYLSGYGGVLAGVYVCPITTATGNLDTCTLSADPLLHYQNQFGIAAH